MSLSLGHTKTSRLLGPEDESVTKKTSPRLLSSNNATVSFKDILRGFSLDHPFEHSVIGNQRRKSGGSSPLILIHYQYYINQGRRRIRSTTMIIENIGKVEGGRIFLMAVHALYGRIVPPMLVKANRSHTSDVLD